MATAKPGALFLALAIAFLPGIGAAERLRVTSWNLGVSSQTGPSESTLRQAAATLSSLDPDVILLQGVRDWPMCSRLTELLGPAEYSVLVCSAFHEAPGSQSTPPQVAILAKQKAYFTWSEAWQSPQRALPGGAAFAAIQTATQRLGLFTSLAGAGQSAEALAQRILGDIELIGHWDTNQVQTFVIAASFDLGGSRSARASRRAAAAFERAGFVDVTEQSEADLTSPAERRGASADCLMAGPNGFPRDAHVSTTPFAEHYPTIFEVELDPDKVSLALDIRAEKRREQQARMEALAKRTGFWVGGSAGCVVIIGCAAGWRRKRRNRRSMLPQPAHHPPPPRAAPKAALPSPRPVAVAPALSKPVETAPVRVSPKVRPVLRLQKRVTSVEPPPLPGDAEGPEPGRELATLARTEPLMPRFTTVTGLPEEHEAGHGLIKDLSAWLKHKLVRKLVQDRTQLMQAQQLATRMASTLDSRLARIEAQIQEQNQAYARRIDELNQELAAAREENRELIRERIAQVKAEMEAARARVLAEAELDNSSLRL